MENTQVSHSRPVFLDVHKLWYEVFNSKMKLALLPSAPSCTVSGLDSNSAPSGVLFH